MDCQSNHIDKKLVEDLILCADAVCEALRDTCGCEGCEIWQTWYYDTKEGNPTEKELEEWECPKRDIVEKLRKQVEER